LTYMRFVHLINPFHHNGFSPKDEQLRKLTFDFLIKARENSLAVHEVKLISAQYEEDRTIVPSDFECSTDLQSSIRDIAGFSDQKKLPFMQELLLKLQAFPDADYYVYTNMDILLHPDFYQRVAKLLMDEKTDALIINRRRIEEKWLDFPDQIIAQKGCAHPGYDCFVFHKSILQKIEMGKTVVSVPGMGALFAHNLFLQAQKCLVITSENLTFHLGMELVKSWANEKLTSFQLKQVLHFVRNKRQAFSVEKFPGYHLPFYRRHSTWLMNPLFHYPTMFRLDLPRLFDGRKTGNELLDGSGLMDWKKCSE
jgi:hypothetical protein